MSSPPIVIPFGPELASAFRHAGLNRLMADRVALLVAQISYYATEKSARYPRRRRMDGHLYVQVRYEQWVLVFPNWESESVQIGNIVRHVSSTGTRIGALVTAPTGRGLWYRCEYLRIEEMCQAALVTPPRWVSESPLREPDTSEMQSDIFVHGEIEAALKGFPSPVLSQPKVDPQLDKEWAALAARSEEAARRRNENAG